eukprot:TRINITY_DN4516_c0_g1_i15.p1 TRINITY_DN4516_c0_g1~~TRINITY_DN4516_c0_g1_i15.p1  ORF type:complete len:1012 (-),score=157.30 TRINITY_DN4516_c0_g1_i15:194-3229(-)
MEIIAPILEIVKLAWAPIGRRIGYIKNLKKNIEELNGSAKDLFALRDDVQNVISTSISKVATCECGKWLGDVKLEEDEVNNIEAESREEMKWWCPNVYYSMKLGKRVEESKERIINLSDKRETFKGREMVAAPWKKFERQFVKNVGTSSTTELTLQKILKYIEDVEVQTVGIVGMGGVGKTLTMKLLNNRLGEESPMFEIIIFVTVSGEGNRRKMQNDIADRLEFPSSNVSDNCLKETIRQFLQGKKFLLLLDDVWEQIDLPDIGIPVVNQDNGCKVVLTSRDIGVCQRMETDVNIQIKKLSEEDAWSLFNEKVRDVTMSPKIEPIARNIVKKCDGLPLAIIVIGSSLRHKSNVAVWRSTLAELESSPPTCQIKGMEKEVFSCLRISYDRLPNDCERTLFLYCSLYPEDYEIVITELAEYCWLEGDIQGDSIEKARDKGCHMVSNLVDASLLESGSHEKHIKMHDIVRLFALNEASRFLVGTGDHEKHPPEKKEWLQSRKILLMGCSLRDLLDWPNCRTLSTLVLQNNNQVTMIPDSFYESMHSLRLLDLSGTDIKSLPSTLCNLNNLRGLYLRGCHKLEELPTQVGKLKQLEVLDLGYSTAIRYLPKEVGELTCLKRLTVGFQYCVCSQNDGEDPKEWNMKLRVPTGIIPKLPYLEELSLYVCLDDVCVEREQWDDESMEAVIEELCRLEHLTYLDAYFPKVECLEHFLRHSKSVKATSWFRRFRFRVGTQIGDRSLLYREGQEWERCLVYNGGFGMSQATIMETLARCSIFHLQDHRTARKLSELGLANMNELKECWVESCEKMETLFDGDEQQENCALLPNLKILTLENLPELRRLCDGPFLPGSLSKLRDLHLSSCKNLKKVFQLGIIRQLCSLESLCVVNCGTMEEIIEIEEEEMSMSVASHTHNVISYNNDRLILPNIKKIHLYFLPELVSICRGFSNFEWPSLQTIYILGCPKLKSLSFLSNGTNIVAPALKKIECKSPWWEALEWEDNDIKQRLQPFFSESPW